MTDYSFSFYNPHNARFYFNFNKWNFKPTPELKSCNYGHELKLDSFEGCRIVVKKSQIEITNCIDSERKFTISGSDLDRKERVLKVASILELEAINVLKKFINIFGGTSDFIVVSRRIHDNKILHDEVIDSLSLDSQWNDDVSKKVYNKNSVKEPKNVEFKKEVYGQNYFRNAGLRLFAPEIASRLDTIENERLEFSKALSLYTEQINLHLKVEQRQLEVQEAMLNHFNNESRKDRLKSLKDEWW